ncbi:nucleotidyltransferase domain-containing protein [Nitrosomonas communis]|uniref:nucleotidyltransferase domain-containing protein n=1 Tax=Nitrosomonas communis TaxID=44574 RepID=UPI0026F124E8|nr:nucleotidyltransferase domain-containing protein [Nitrosomonas communis]MCO6428350.1 nucleotidyltransferase domain-containing protein [Nitrosomonas communis]
MGINAIIQTGLSDALFTKTQQRVLGLLFGNPDRSYYANEIVRFAGIGIGTVQRELGKLARTGLLTVTQIGNQKHYQANHQSPIFEELRGIALKTFGLADALREALSTLADRIKVAFIYGSVAKGADRVSSDIDVMIISSDLTYFEVISQLTKVETRLGRAINPTLYKFEDLARKRAEDNAFVSRVLAQPKIFLIGTEDDLA